MNDPEVTMLDAIPKPGLAAHSEAVQAAGTASRAPEVRSAP